MHGNAHVSTSTNIDYAFCPPTSGDHYNASGRGPIRPGVYPDNEEQVPGGWIHNLEHGYIVALYRCTGPDDCPTEEELAQMQAFYDQAPDSGTAACPTKVVVARFDQMEKPFALLAWGRALLLDEFDLDTALTFAEQWTNHDSVPEPAAC